MKMKNSSYFFLDILLLIFLISLPLAFAEEHDTLELHDDPELFGFELEKLLNLGSGILALVLFILTLLAYQRDQRKRLLYVCIAFFLFAVKGFLTAHELFFAEWSWVDPLASALNFVILLCFFVGLLKK